MACRLATTMTEELAGIVNGTLDAYALRGKRVAIALSGGVDSVVLLDLLHELRGSQELSLSAVHVNHQLSAHAGEWEVEAAEILFGQRQVAIADIAGLLS